MPMRTSLSSPVGPKMFKSRDKPPAESIKKEMIRYDKIAKTYDKGGIGWHYARKRKLSFLLTGLKPHVNGKSLIDIGCGNGIYMVPFIEGNMLVCGIDISSNMLKEARRKVGRKANLIHASMYNLPIKNDCFDFVVSFGPTMQTQEAALKEAHRIAKNEARLFLDFINELSPLTWIKYTIRKLIADPSYFFRLHVFWSIKKKLLRFNFRVVRASSCIFLPIKRSKRFTSDELEFPIENLESRFVKLPLINLLGACLLIESKVSKR